MAAPVIVVVDDEEPVLQQLAHELASRYGLHYRIVACASGREATARLEELRDERADVPLILADQWMPGQTGTEFLAHARGLHPTARRGLLISWGDRSTAAPILEGIGLGQIDFYVPKPAWTPDEQFHRAVTESLDDWWRRRGGRFEGLTVIGEDSSPRVHEVRDILTRVSIPFGFLRSDSEEGRAALRRFGIVDPAGPVIAMYNGVVLIDPTNADVAANLGVDVRPSDETYDVAIVGAGPAGLAAAVYGASEGLRTAMLEREAFGGQAGTSSLIRNYLGFPRGVSGADLAARAYEQAWLFGAHPVYGNPVRSLRELGDLRVLLLDDGSEVRARVVVLATGVTYRRLDVPSLESLVGAGVFYGAATVEAQALTGKRAFVVGGGNSAGQAAVYLARYAASVTVLVRSASLAASMSEYLIREIANAPGLDVRFGVEVVGGGGDVRLERLELRERATGEVETVPADGLFVLIGAEPLTAWIPEDVRRDRWGYVLTGPDLGDAWTSERPPFLLETSMPGVFAAGDVRHGSIKRVASAVGEGSTCVRLVHELFAMAAGEPAGP